MLRCGSLEIRFPDGRPSRFVYDIPGRRLRPKWLLNLCDCPNPKNPHSGDMAINALHLVGLAALILLTAGAYLRYGASVAVGVCMVGAVALRLVAP